MTNTSVPAGVDLAAFVAQLDARRTALSDEIVDLTAQRAALNDTVKERRKELAGVERLWRATQPRRVNNG